MHEERGKQCLHVVVVAVVVVVIRLINNVNLCDHEPRWPYKSSAFEYNGNYLIIASECFFITTKIAFDLLSTPSMCSVPLP